MAFALKGFGSGSTANSATANQASFVITTTTTAGASGDLAVVCYAVDNAVTGDGDEGAVSRVTDSGGNVWFKAIEFSNGQAAAQAGATCGIWYSNLTSALAIGGTITLTYITAASRDASAANVSFWTKTSGTFAVVEAKASLANDAALAGSLNATTANIECLRIRAIATESATATALTKTAAFTAIMTQAVASTAMAIRGEYLISTSTGQASAPTGGVSADNASVYVAFKEATSQIALERSAHANTVATSVAVSSFTTAMAPGQIIVCVGTNATGVTSVTATGLTFTQRSIITPSGSWVRLAIYTAPYTTNFSGTITVALPASAYTSVDVMAVTGVSSVSGVGAPPFDSHASLPATATSGSPSATTANAKDFVFATVAAGGAGSNWASPDAWSLMPGSGGADFLNTLYRIQEATGTFTFTTNSAGAIIDALVGSAVAAAPAQAGTMSMMGVG